MKVILQYKVIGHYNCDGVKHNIKKLVLRDRSDKWKDAFDLKIKMCVIR